MENKKKLFWGMVFDIKHWGNYINHFDLKESTFLKMFNFSFSCTFILSFGKIL